MRSAATTSLSLFNEMLSKRVRSAFSHKGTGSNGFGVLVLDSPSAAVTFGNGLPPGVKEMGRYKMGVALQKHRFSTHEI